METERLLLRPPDTSDRSAWTAFLADSEVTRFIGGPQDEAGAWRNLCLFAGAWSIQGYSNFSVIEKASGLWVGRAGPWYPPGWPGREIGWAFRREVWGQGYATEAATACLVWAYEELGWTEAIHVIHSENLASIAVAKRIGAVLQASGTEDNNLVYMSVKDTLPLRSARGNRNEDN